LCLQVLFLQFSGIEGLQKQSHDLELTLEMITRESKVQMVLRKEGRFSGWHRQIGTPCPVLRKKMSVQDGGNTNDRALQSLTKPRINIWPKHC
jgi:hypothetical protein